MVNDIINRIESFLRQNAANIIEHEGKIEPSLLKSIGFSNGLNVNPDRTFTEALFGYPRLKTDYQPDGHENTVIEVKRIGLVSGRSNRVRENECDIKNGLAQILEQAQCKNAENAILVVIDGGRSANRNWNQREIQYINNIRAGFNDINLVVIRARVGKNPPQAQIQRI
jgi:hypothetical protein